MKRGRRWEKSGDPTGMVTDMIFCLVFQADTPGLVTEYIRYAARQVSDHYFGLPIVQFFLRRKCVSVYSLTQTVSAQRLRAISATRVSAR